MSLCIERRTEIPQQSWLCVVDQRSARLIVGDAVEVFDRGAAEGAWAGELTPEGFLSSAFRAGSGIFDVGDALRIAPPSHTCESVFLLNDRRSGTAYVSNSLVFCYAASGIAPHKGLWQRGMSISKGLTNAQLLLAEDDACTLHKLSYCDFLLRPDGSLERLPLPAPVQIASYQEFADLLVGTVAAVSENATLRGRRRSYELLTTVSSGYDSAACAAIAAKLGCREAVTLRSARRARADSGKPIGDALGLHTHEFDRPEAEETERQFVANESVDGLFDVAAEFLASGMSGDDVAMSNFSPLLPGRLLLTGFHGDKVWNRATQPNPDILRGDTSGSSLFEFRSRLGFLHLPVPFIGARSHESIWAINNSEEMRPWRISGGYDRPVARRLAEEAGVPREAFGQQKAAAAMIFPGINGLVRRGIEQVIPRYESAARGS